MKLRQIIPPITARTPAGRRIRARDYKQKKNLVIAFLQPRCPRCEEFLLRLGEHAAVRWWRRR